MKIIPFCAEFIVKIKVVWFFETWGYVIIVQGAPIKSIPYNLLPITHQGLSYLPAG